MFDHGSLERVEARLAALEDELAIIRLIASYGPLVDAGGTQDAPALFAEDAVYDVGAARFQGPAEISGMLSGDLHQRCVADGIAHAMGLPWVRLDGDKAVATNVTQVYLREGDRFKPWRIAQNVWHLERSGQGWQVANRWNRLIGDDGEAVEMLREVVALGGRATST